MRQKWYHFNDQNHPMATGKSDCPHLSVPGCDLALFSGNMIHRGCVCIVRSLALYGPGTNGNSYVFILLR